MTSRNLNPDSPPGKAEKYARRERERRFLLAAVPAQGPVRRVMIEDRYLVGTRLRLRRMTDLGAADAPGRVIHKLTQKIPAPEGTPGLITTLYLSAAEYQAVARIPAETLEKVRTSIPPVGVDEFRGPLTGLILAEAEFASDEEAAAFQPPMEPVAEVTADERFTGGRLVRASAEDTHALLTEFGIATTQDPAVTDHRPTDVIYHWRGPFENEALNALHAEGFGHPVVDFDWNGQVTRHSLGWVCARVGQELVGFVSVVWDGGVHAFILDTLVQARVRRRGIGAAMVAMAVSEARQAGCEWLHVDFEGEDLRTFYAACGFVPTEAGVMALQEVAPVRAP